MLWSRSRRSTVIAAMLMVLCTDAPAAEHHWIPKGHYFSFAKTRDLQAEMVRPIESSETASNFHLKIARNLLNALETPGLRGIWMEFEWRSLEVADGRYDWSLLDANMDIAADLGLKFIVEPTDRSFNGTNILPTYFPPEQVLWFNSHGNSGVVAKRWDPYVYNRLIRLYTAIAERYADHPAYGGIATAETAIGNIDGGAYSIDKYKHALIEIISRTHDALPAGKLLFYMNFLRGGDSSDMNRDARVALLKEVPHTNLVVGGPDILPDSSAMPRSVTAYRLHVRKTMSELEQFCHAQHVDQGGDGMINLKDNTHRQAYFEEVARARERESQSWFKGEPAVFEFDDLRDPDGNKVDLHPDWVLGQPWKPEELLSYATRNFDCQYFLWHYREWPGPGEFWWPDIQTVIENNQCFYQEGGCDGVSLRKTPRPPGLMK